MNEVIATFDSKMKDLVIKTSVITLLFFIAFAPAFAQLPNIWEGTGTDEEATCNVEGHCGFCDAAIVATNIIEFLVQLSVALATLMISFGAVLIMVSGANEKWYEMGKTSVTNAVVGLAITLGSWIIVNTIINTLLIADDVSWAWQSPSCGG